MGRDRYWGGSKSWRRGGGGGGGGGGVRSGGGKEEGDSASTATGCLCPVFNLFHFHQVQFALDQQQPSFKSSSFLSEESSILKGSEAPKNSLELEEPPLSSCAKGDNLTIPMGIQIKTKGAPTDSSSSEISSSPGAKTPNLVARLMGLEILPDEHTYSPRVSTSSNLRPTNRDRTHSHLDHRFRPRQALPSKAVICRSSLDSDFTGTRSLPETPRISSARRSDVDHRLSLQINKENMSASEEVMLSRISSLRRKGLKTKEEYGSTDHYARQIVKQVKESVSRKVGLDITNTVRNREQRSCSREEIVRQFKLKDLTKVVDHDLSPSSNCSPRLKFSEAKHKPSTTVISTESNISQTPVPSISTSSRVVEQYSKASTKPKLQPIAEDQHRRPIKKKCKKGSEEKFSPPTTRLKKLAQTSDIIRNKQEPFVRATAATGSILSDKKCKKTPLSNNLLPVKKDPSPPATKIPQKQLSSCSSQSYNLQPPRDSGKDNNVHEPNGAGRTATNGDAEEYEYYITRVLRGTGIEKDAPASFTGWFSPFHPLDPSIFHHLELQQPFSTTPTNNNASHRLGQRRNRKLLFHPVDEILVGILRPSMNMRPWASSIRHHHGHVTKGSQLVDVLCSEVTSFPRADCRVLEDIYALIDKDLPQLKTQSGWEFEEEGESIVTDIEEDILDTLIHETAVVFGGWIEMAQR